MTRLLIHGSIAALLAGIAPAAADVPTGTLNYPALDNLKLREGTIEFWVRPDFDIGPVEPSDEYRSLATIFSVAGDKGGFNMHVPIPVKSDRALWWCSVGPKTLFTPFGMGGDPVARGEWHHVALTWKDNRMWCYIDGKLKGESVPCQASFAAGMGSLAGKAIVFGDPNNVRGRFAIDELRISRIARQPEELGFHGPLKPDAYTSLFDPFECDFTPDGNTTTQPTAAFRGAGVPSVQCRFVDGKFGKSISLFDPGATP